MNDEQLNNLNLICKWGCDGSSQDEYKQKFSDPNFSDASVFIISFVPLQLETNVYILWEKKNLLLPTFAVLLASFMTKKQVT